MAVSMFVFSAFILVFLILVLVLGFSIHMCRNYCLKRIKGRRRAPTDPRAPGALEAAFKTTTDDENTLTTRPMKTHTFDQILKQEESSAYSVHPLKLPQPMAQTPGNTVNSSSQLASKTPELRPVELNAGNNEPVAHQQKSLSNHKSVV